MSEITEQQEIAQEISDAISRPVGFGDDVDEEELLAELEEMEQEDLEKDLLSVEDQTPAVLPSIPSDQLPSLPSQSNKKPAKAEDEDDEMRELANWAL
ncbi:charged multivesicular body protein 4c-like [Huso huso]|uniref:Charged multivesicular body protein 4c-like n=1 Tax=Huso huso TaxID=61971 RepID=A0ABR0Y5I0_HUSHU